MSEKSANEKVAYSIKQNELGKLFGLTPQGAAIHIKNNKIPTFKYGNKTALSPEAARRFLETRGLRYPNAILSFQMLKGGSTKTSTAFNLAVRLNQYGARVLVVDLDMQGNLSAALGVDVITEDEAKESSDKNVQATPVWLDIADGETPINEIIMKIGENLDLIPSSFDNSSLEYFINFKKPNLATFIAQHLAPLKRVYDFIIIDCNPSLSALNISIMLSSDRIIIPINPDKFSYNGLAKTLKEIERIEKDYNTNIDYRLLFTLFDGRETTSKDYLIRYGSKYKDKLLDTAISRNADVKNSIDQNCSIFDFPKATAREDFDNLALEILGFKDIQDLKGHKIRNLEAEL